MSARLARSAVQSATRRAQTTVSASAARVSRRAMSSTSTGAAKSSDTPWIVGSLLVFGPAFLYLVSPSARKNQHGIHNDEKEYPALKHKAESHDAPVELMKDDEGTEANVGASISLSQGSDVPKDSQSPEKQAELRTESESAEVPEQSEKSEGADVQEEKGDHSAKSNTYQEEGDNSPVDQDVAQEGAKKGVLPLDDAKGEKL